MAVYPKSHFVTSRTRLRDAVETIKTELVERRGQLESEGKLLEAQRLHQRTMFDLEMIREIGYCHGIENYSRHLTGRAPGEPPPTLLDYLPPDALVIVDESHQTVPQVRGMYHGDRSRKEVLVDYGFRLPSALDNRPLNFEEWEARVPQLVYVSATPGPYELHKAGGVVVEQVIRPTGLMDPPIEVRPVKGQVDDLLQEIRDRPSRRERVLVTTLTKRMAEDLTTYYQELGVKVRYLHSDIDTLERVEILRDLRRGVFDVLVGINLLREGSGPPGGVAGGDPGCRQGRISPVWRGVDSDVGPRGAKHQRPGHHVRRRDDRVHAGRHQRDRAAAGTATGLQRGTRHHPDEHRQGDRRRAVERVRARLWRGPAGEGGASGVPDAGRARRTHRGARTGDEGARRRISISSVRPHCATVCARSTRRLPGARPSGREAQRRAEGGRACYPAGGSGR